jgi:hypothetical protein
MAARLARSARICFFHGVLDGRGWVNGFDLDAVDPQPPLAGGIVKHTTELAVDGVTGGECLLQVHGADDVAQGGDGELLDGLEVAGDLVGGGAGVGDLEVQHGVDLDDQVVLGDDRLGLEGGDLFPQVDLPVDAVDVGDDEVEARLQGAVVAAESFDVAGPGLRHDAHRPQHGEHGEHGEEQSGDEESRDFHGHSLG